MQTTSTLLKAEQKKREKDAGKFKKAFFSSLHLFLRFSTKRMDDGVIRAALTLSNRFTDIRRDIDTRFADERPGGRSQIASPRPQSGCGWMTLSNRFSALRMDDGVIRAAGANNFCKLMPKLFTF